LAALPNRPWRKIHLDFHNSEHVPKIGARFDANEWGDRLSAASVDAIVVFAKDMHGYFYYPSQYGPVHPGLSFDLLGAQVEACRQRKIAVYAYYCTTWDNYLAARHPEWRQRKRDGSDYQPGPKETPGWTALCLTNPDFVRLMRDHSHEFVSRYELDGAWYDMPVPRSAECWCRNCKLAMEARGLDVNDRPAQHRHKQELEVAFQRTLRDAVRNARPGCQVDFNGQAVYGLKDRVAFMDNIDLEALPSSSAWGYYYFPLTTRYVRTHGVTAYGMTGRFKASWADFGGLKLPAQLDVELASIVANAARCDIGDQMPPSGRLDPAVYHVIGKSYAKIKRIEPYLAGAVPVSEAAMLVAGEPLDWPNTETHLGWTKLLMEARVQFDVVEPGAAWERYGLLLLPETLEVNAGLAARLRTYVEKGGAVIVSHDAGRIAGTRETWLQSFGLRYDGPSPYQPAYMVPEENFTGDIPAYEYALYEGASQWRAEGQAKVLARLGEPAFQRSAEHYTSHAQTPFERVTQYAAVAASGRAGLVAFPLGKSYFTQGYWVYAAAFRHLLGRIVRPLVGSSAPAATEIEVTHQAAAPGRGERYLVHIVNWSPGRGAPKHPVFHEEPVPLADVRITLDLPLAAARARAVIAGQELPVRRTAQGLEVRVPRVEIHEIVSFEA
jgi:hypothetical protein